MLKVENLGKAYQIRQQRREQYTALRDVITNSVSHWASRLRRERNGAVGHTQETFWALDNISFEVKPGERIGIIGRNGAGKSTLLKLISRITEPTKGRIHVKGRVASLLEVGTGFHPELTGRENIYLNGAILGMSREEIRRKFEEIVTFAEVEKFLDTPVKHYSSGMYVRLAFAVAAHLEPEILVLDEVLAVGDNAFHKKCLDKMKQVAQTEGRTIFFVSHTMAHIESICSQAILLDGGKVISQGTTAHVIQAYLDSRNHATATPDLKLSEIPRTTGLKPLIIDGKLNNNALVGEHLVKPGHPIEFEFMVNTQERLPSFTMGIHFETATGLRIYAVNTRWALQYLVLSAGRSLVHCTIDSLPLVPGSYTISIGISSRQSQLDWLERIARIQVTVEDIYGTGELPWQGQGYFLSKAKWEVLPMTTSEA